MTQWAGGETGDTGCYRISRSLALFCVHGECIQ
jgi:hypothetical protein